MTMSIRVVIADDHEVMRAALRMVLTSQPDILVVGEVNDGLQAVDAVRSLQPDVVVMDIAMPHLNGLEAARQICSLIPATKVIMVTAYDNDAYLRESQEVGALACIPKSMAGRELVPVVQLAALAS